MYDVIVPPAAWLTLTGSFKEKSAPLAAPKLGAAIRAAVADTGLTPADIDELFMGRVLCDGLGQARARPAALAAGKRLPTPRRFVGR